MNFVHFRIFTLLSKDFEKESTNHENAISELETGIWNWKLEIEQKHKLEVVNYITADTTMKSNRLHSGKECLSKHSYFFISLIVRLTLKLKDNLFICLIFE